MHLMDDLSKAEALCDNMATLSDTDLDVISSAEGAETLSDANLDDLSSSENVTVTFQQDNRNVAELQPTS